MATISDLVANLKLRARILPEEKLSSPTPLDEYLEEVIADAIEQHNPALTLANLPAAEEQLVLLLAQIEICYVRAEKFVNDAAVQAGGQAFVQNLDSPFNKNIKLAQQLTARYNDLVSRLGVSSGAAEIVVQSTVYKRSDRLDRLFPYFNVPMAPAPLLTGTLQEEEEDVILLEWSAPLVDYFYRFWLFWSLTPGIYQDWNAVGNMTVPRIKSSATLIFNTWKQDQQAIEAEGFPAASDNYFLIVSQTQQNKFTYSDEIVVTTA